MIDTHPFSHNIIYDQLKDFFVAHGIEKSTFKKERPNLIQQQTIAYSDTGNEFHAFSLDYRHNLWHKFGLHLAEKFHFKSQLSHLIKAYDELFNQSGQECYKAYDYHFVTVYGKIEKVYAFDFDEIINGHDYMSLLETKDTDIASFEQEILEYYASSFAKELPAELIKPISTMTEAERDLVRMVCI